MYKKYFFIFLVNSWNFKNFYQKIKTNLIFRKNFKKIYHHFSKKKFSETEVLNYINNLPENIFIKEKIKNKFEKIFFYYQSNFFLLEIIPIFGIFFSFNLPYNFFFKIKILDNFNFEKSLINYNIDFLEKNSNVFCFSFYFEKIIYMILTYIFFIYFFFKKKKNLKLKVIILNEK